MSHYDPAATSPRPMVTPEHPSSAVRRDADSLNTPEHERRVAPRIEGVPPLNANANDDAALNIAATNRNPAAAGELQLPDTPGMLGNMTTPPVAPGGQAPPPGAEAQAMQPGGNNAAITDPDFGNPNPDVTHPNGNDDARGKGGGGAPGKGDGGAPGYGRGKGAGAPGKGGRGGQGFGKGKGKGYGKGKGGGGRGGGRGGKGGKGGGRGGGWNAQEWSPAAFMVKYGRTPCPDKKQGFGRTGKGGGARIGTEQPFGLQLVGDANENKQLIDALAETFDNLWVGWNKSERAYSVVIDPYSTYSLKNGVSDVTPEMAREMLTYVKENFQATLPIMSAFLVANAYNPVQVFPYSAAISAEIQRPKVTVQISDRMICGPEGYYEYCDGRFAYVWGDTFYFKEWLKSADEASNPLPGYGKYIMPVATLKPGTEEHIYCMWQFDPAYTYDMQSRGGSSAASLAECLRLLFGMNVTELEEAVWTAEWAAADPIASAMADNGTGKGAGPSWDSNDFLRDQFGPHDKW